MNYYEDRVIIENYKSFNIKEILECGQCFRFEKISEGYYEIIAHNKRLRIKQEKDKIEFENTSKQDFENIWLYYFDFHTDYDKIKDILREKDSVMEDAIEYAPGIRILNQEPWECLISFILSQNRQIPMIKKTIKYISDGFGGSDCSFPTPEQLSAASEDDLKRLKTGFRAKYIIDATIKVLTNEVDLYSFDDLSTSDVRERLMTIKGVGPKVSDCVMLFSLNRREVFPTDVWVRRVMEYFYFNGNTTSIEKIHELAYEKFGNLAGYAQQYLFHYARNNAIFK